MIARTIMPSAISFTTPMPMLAGMWTPSARGSRPRASGTRAASVNTTGASNAQSSQSTSATANALPHESGRPP